MRGLASIVFSAGDGKEDDRGVVKLDLCVAWNALQDASRELLQQLTSTLS